MEPAETLTGLGLNQLEAEIYCHLLQSDAQTPYRVAQSLGRQTANVYRAVDILARRGAVMIEEGESRLCRAVPVREFLRHMESDFATRVRGASEALSELERTTSDERIYRIESVAEVISRATMMLEKEAVEVAVVDVFPKAWEAIRPAVEKAIARGVRVQLQTYEPVDVATEKVVVAYPAAAVLEYWGSEQLNIVIDGRQHLLALLSADLERVHQAVWSSSLYLATLLHAGMTSEQTIHRLLHMTEKKKPAAAIVRALREHKFLKDSRVPGQLELLARFKRKK